MTGFPWHTKVASLLRTIPVRWRRAIKIHTNVRIGRWTRIDVVGDLGSVQVAAGVYIGDGCQIVGGPGDIVIGPNVFIGDDVILSAWDRLELRSGSRLGMRVSVRTGNHVTRLNAVPFRLQGHTWSPIVIDAGAIIEDDAVITAGVTIGKGARVAPRAVVTRDVGALVSVAGAPARPA